MLFDQAVFQQKGIVFIVYKSELNVVNLGYEPGSFPVGVSFSEIAGDPFFQILCLSDIDQNAFLTEIFINAGMLWKVGKR